MTKFIVNRLIQSIIVIIVVTFIVFLAVRLLPGDPIFLYLSRQEYQTLTEADIQLIRHEFGLDRPLIVQYGNWIADLFRGDMGMSLFYSEKVSTLISQRLPVTIHLGILAFIFSSLFGILAGVLSAIRRGKFTDNFVTTLANIGVCAPVFWLGILLIYLFGLKLHWLPMFGYTSPFDDFSLSTRQAILPVICLMIFGLAATTRQTRSSMLEIIRQDYVRTAWSKGLSERLVIARHVLKNGLIPVVTLMGVGFSHILGGSVLIETVFNIPGMGRLSVSALLAQDYAIVQAIALISAAMVAFTNLLVDILYGWLDPRIRFA